jgi:hypothetical protein
MEEAMATTETEANSADRIIESAFKMTEQLVGTSTRLAERIAKTSQDALSASDKND